MKRIPERELRFFSESAAACFDSLLSRRVSRSTRHPVPTWGVRCPSRSDRAGASNGLSTGPSLGFDEIIVDGQTTAFLHASNSSRAPRQRGPAMPVLPMLLDLAGNPRFHVGYAEEWDRRTGPRPYRFKASNLTFFMFPRDNARPVQLFRAEWPGIREWTRGTVGFQSPDSGHPHWQFDALDYYMSREQRFARLRRTLSLLESRDDAPVDFDPLTSDTAVDLSVEEEAIDTSWTAVHFAAGARWPFAPWMGNGKVTDTHVLAPTELKHIRAWVISAVVYTRDELLKCCVGCRI
jgi:hypothetical protein